MIGRLESPARAAGTFCFTGGERFEFAAGGFAGPGGCPQAGCSGSNTHPSNIKKQYEATSALPLDRVDDRLRDVFEFNKHGPLVDVEIFIVSVARILFCIDDHFFPVNREENIVASIGINFRKWP